MAITIEGPVAESKRIGENLVLWAIVAGDEFTGAPMWTKDGQPLRAEAVPEGPRLVNGETTLTLSIEPAEAADSGAYQVAVEAKDGSVVRSEVLNLLLDAARDPDRGDDPAGVEAPDPAQPAPPAAAPPMIWDGKFAQRAALALIVVFGVALIPLWWAAGRILDDGDPTTTQFVTFGLVIASFMALGAAVFVALLEVRGRARTAEELSGRRAGTRGAASPEQVNELIKTFGSLKVPAALMVLSAAYFAGAFGLAWKEAAPPPPSPPASATTAVPGG